MHAGGQNFLRAVPAGLVGISLKYRIQLPPDFVVLARTFLGAEGLAGV